jgi:putative flippase GtrA
MIARAWQAGIRLLRDQRVLFLIVGGVNTAFSTALFAGLVLVFGPRVPSAVSLVLAWLISLVTVFVVYRRLVFRHRDGHWFVALLRFASVSIVSLLVNAALLTLLVDVAHWPPIPVQIGITLVIVVFNYFAHKYFSFRKKSSSPYGP